MSQISDKAVPGDPAQAWQAALEDAKTLLQSPELSVLFWGSVLSHCLTRLVQEAIASEIQNGWEVDNAGLVMEAICRSAVHYVDTQPVPAEALREQMLSVLLPLVDACCIPAEAEAEGVPGSEAAEDSGGTEGTEA